MPDFICVTNNYWGAKKGEMRIYNAGEIVAEPECPNNHFEPVGGAIHDGPKIDASGMIIDWDGMNKTEIVERFKLPYRGKSKINAVRKSQLVSEAMAVMEKENGNG